MSVAPELVVRVLGPVRAEVAGAAVRLRPKDAVLLALLATFRNRDWTTDALALQLWPSAAPQDERAAVQAGASRLRTLLPPGAVETVGEAYRLGAGVEVDAEWAATRVEQALSLVDVDPVAAVRDLDEVLAVWSDAPLADVTSAPLLEAKAAALRGGRVDAEQARAMARLGAGRTAEAVASFRSLIGLHPEREGLWVGLIRALEVDGRPLDAAAAAHRALAVLAERGLAPAPELAAAIERLPARSVPAGVPDTLLVRTHDGRFVGRDHEMAVARDAWRASARGPALLLLRGDPGIGKTRLAAEAAVGLAGDGVRVLHGWCDQGWSPPHQPFRTALGPSAPQAVTSPAGDPQVGRERWLDAFVAAVAAQAGRAGLVVVVDDLQWADPSSVDLLGRCVRAESGVPTLFIATTRDDGGLPFADALGGTTMVDLTGLDGGASAELADAVGGGVDPALVLDLTDGNPLLVRELIRGGDVDAEGRAPLGGLVDRLAPAHREVLTLAAVSGGTVDPDVLRRVQSGDPTTVDDALADGARCGLLVGEGGRLRFRHDLYRDELRRRMTAAGVERAHASVAVALLEQAGGDPDAEVAYAVAHHMGLAAGTVGVAVAVDQLRRAAGRARDEFAFDRAASLLGRAEELLEADGAARDRSWVRLELAQVLDAAGRRPEAVAVAALAFDEALTLDEDEVVVRAALVHASTWAVGDSPRSASMLEAAASTVGAAPAELLSARSLLAFYRAPVLSRQDRWAAFDALEAEAGHGNEPHLVAQVLIDRRASLVDPDDAEDRLRCGRALMAIAEEVADDHLRLLGTMSAWLAGFELGEMDFDAPELREFCALATARPIRYYPWIAGCAEVLQHIRDGHFDAAAAALAETYELGVGTVGEGDAFPVFAAQQFSLAWAAGDDARVRELIEAAELVSANVDSFVAWDALVALGWFDLGDRDRAVARLAGFGGGPGPRNLAWTTNVAILALCAWAGGDATASEQRYQDLSPYRDRSILSGFGAFVGSGAHFLAYAAAGAGREDEVVPLLRQAQAHHRQLGSRPMALRTELELGARLQHRGEAAGTALLEQVVREAESLGVGSVAARAERALLERPAAAWP